jgi:putative flippase GtrA
MILRLIRTIERIAAGFIGYLERLDHPWLSPVLRFARRHGLWQFVRFLTVGGLNFLFYYTLFTAFHLLSVPPTQAVIIATIIAVMFNFCTTGQLVFGNRRAQLLPRFVGVYVVQAILNIQLLRMLMAAGVPVLIAEALVIGVLAVLTFVALRRFVFSERSDADQPAARST